MIRPSARLLFVFGCFENCACFSFPRTGCRPFIAAIVWLPNVDPQLPFPWSDRRDFVAASGLMSYGTNFSELYRQQGAFTGLVLKGLEPAELPVLQLTRSELVINLKTAEALGVKISEDVLARADEVIE